jgi:hypothetical protein
LGVSGNGLLDADTIDTAANVLVVEKAGVAVGETILISSAGRGSSWQGREVIRGCWFITSGVSWATWSKIWINNTNIILADADVGTGNDTQCGIENTIAINGTGNAGLSRVDRKCDGGASLSDDAKGCSTIIVLRLASNISRGT